MKKIILFGFICLVAHSAAFGYPESSGVEEGHSLVALDEDAARTLPPLLYEIRAVLLEREATVAALENELAAATTPDSCRILERRIAAAKVDAELSIYGLQAEYARREGREEEASRYENMARALRNPAPVVAPPAVAPRSEEVR